jgi:hypothetical protein
MAKSTERWNQVYEAFQPKNDPLLGQRSHDLYCEREHSPFEQMCADFRPGLDLVRPPIAYLTGHRGSGKSTLLLRFLERLRHDYFVVYFDVEHNLDTSQANQIDLLYLLGATIFQVAVEEKKKPDPELLEELAKSIFALTETQTTLGKDESFDVVKLASNLICLGSGAFGGSLAEKAAEKLTKGLSDSFKLSSGVSEKRIAEHKSQPQIQKIITCVNLILADVKTKAGQDVLVVVDGLDKLRQPGQAKGLFLETNALRGPRCRIVYTVPMSIYQDLTFGEAEEDCPSYLLPNVKLYEKDDPKKKYRRGYATMREIVDKRVHSIGLESRDLFTPGTLNRIIEKSGGVLRWLIELIKDSSNLAYVRDLDKINRQLANEAITTHTRKLSGRLNTELRDELRKVRESKQLTGSDKTGELLQSRLIVPFFNGDVWYDAHPLVWEVLEE